MGAERALRPCRVALKGLKGRQGMAGIVVVGAGQAGASLVAKLRSEGFDGPLTLIGE